MAAKGLCWVAILEVVSAISVYEYKSGRRTLTLTLTLTLARLPSLVPVYHSSFLLFLPRCLLVLLFFFVVVIKVEERREQDEKIKQEEEKEKREG